eukprot:CCRYP_005722-RA/>CCRYP_005722-RA protein AED:0.48 eAED:-0.79 QI:0/-1/0/1/-1/1/1/0/198
MLEKQAGVCLLSKLRAILLMEADFNAANKILFGQRILDQVRKYRLMPEEIFSERQRMAEDGILAKVLFYDISRQLRAPAALASVDAANCYDRVAHAVASHSISSFRCPTGDDHVHANSYSGDEILSSYSVRRLRQSSRSKTTPPDTRIYAGERRFSRRMDSSLHNYPQSTQGSGTWGDFRSTDQWKLKGIVLYSIRRR